MGQQRGRRLAGIRPAARRHLCAWGFGVLTAFQLVVSAVCSEAGEPRPTATQAGNPGRVLVLAPGRSGRFERVEVSDFAELLSDPGGRLTLADVTSGDLASRFAPGAEFIQPAGLRSGTVWVRLRLHSELAADHVWWLDPGSWGVAELFVPVGDGFTVARSGAFVPPGQRSAPEVDLRLSTLKLSIPKGPQDVTVLLRLQTELSLARDRQVVARLFPELEPDWRRPGRGFVFLQAVTLGVLLALGLYHVVLFVRLRERVYLLFGLSVLGRAVLVAADSRILLEFVWPGSGRWDYAFRLFQGPVWVVPFFLFFMAFLSTKEDSPQLHRLLGMLLVPASLEPLLTWLRPAWYGPVLSGQYIAWAIVPIGVALGALRRHRQEAAIFLAANLVMLGYSISFTLNLTGVGVTLPLWGYFVGEIASATLFSIAVAAHIRRLRREKESARLEEASAELLLKRRELESVLLAGELGEARLQVLRNQIQPHFLFNTLNSISALMHLDVAEAERKLALLADLLRSALAEHGGNEVPLGEEIDFVSRYLEIEQTRFPKRLSVVWDTEPACLDALVPHLILQPLVENAVRHGIAPRSGPGTVRVRSRIEEGKLILEVRDDGVGLSGRVPGREGVGLSNTRARLKHLHGAAASLVVGEAAGGGFVATVTLPLRRSERLADGWAVRGAGVGPP